MKNLKTTLLLTVCLATATLAKAQQAKQLQAPIPVDAETKQQPAANVKSNPSPAPEFKPQAAGATAQKSNNDIPADMEAEKLQALPKPDLNPNSKLTAGQIKTANGASERPAMVVPPGTEAKPAKPKPVVAVAPADQ